MGVRGALLVLCFCGAARHESGAALAAPPEAGAAACRRQRVAAASSDGLTGGRLGVLPASDLGACEVRLSEVASGPIKYDLPVLDAALALDSWRTSERNHELGTTCPSSTLPARRVAGSSSRFG